MIAQDFTDIDVIKGDIKLTWEHIGEGCSGDYDETDPTDRPLLRFSLWYRDGDEWVELDDSSYCTGLPTDTDTDKLRQYADEIIASIGSKGIPTQYKRTLERWSWLGVEEVNTPRKENQ